MTVTEIISLVASSIVVVFLAIGIAKRRRRDLHVRIMVSCFVVDVLNVVLIEASLHFGGETGAVKKSIDSLTSGELSILVVHIVASVLSLVGYGVATWTGRRILAGDESARKLHKINAAIFVLARLVNYVTSFSVVDSPGA
ncbi:MAG: DUF420 domain-containing protein [Planctomycetota bacterium]